MIVLNVVSLLFLCCFFCCFFCCCFVVLLLLVVLLVVVVGGRTRKTKDGVVQNVIRASTITTTYVGCFAPTVNKKTTLFKHVGNHAIDCSLKTCVLQTSATIHC